MPVIERLAPDSGDWVGIVEAQQPAAIRRMKGQRVIQTVWFVSGYRHALSDEFDPIPGLWIDNENFTVEVEQNLKTAIVRTHLQTLS